MKNLAELPALVQHELWEKDLTQRPPWQQKLVWLARMIYGVARKFVDNKLSMRAMSLVYTTLLSLVPLLALSFAVLRAFGVHNQLEPTLLEFLDPLGEKKIEITRQIVEFVENLRLGLLSSFGVAMLIYTIISMTHKVEQAFNDVWHVSKPRSLARRFSDYLSVIVVGPVLVFSGLSMTRAALNSSTVQWIASVEPLGTLLYGIGQLVPYVVVCGAFAFIYGFIPNTRVKFSTALVGGVFTGLLWSGASVIFANLMVNSSNYSAIYAGFASVVLFMVWVYLGWMIILVGAQVTFYWQNTRFLDPRLERDSVTNREREEIALDLITLIGQAYHNHEPLWTRPALELHRPQLQPDLLQTLLDRLQDGGLIIASGDEPASFLPARDIGTISVQEVIQLVRGSDAQNQSSYKVGQLMDTVDAAIGQVLADRTILDLVQPLVQTDAEQAPKPDA